jgi:DnaJ family protein B protein 13
MRFARPTMCFPTVRTIIVLTDTLAERKGWFDKYGEYGLKEGVPGPNGNIIGGYRYGGNSFEIFEKVFGTTNPFADRLEDDGKDQFGSMFGDSFGALNSVIHPAPKDIKLTITCTLTEFYNGCLKKISYNRLGLMHDGRTQREIPVDIEVEVKPGFSEKTVLTFANKGNEAEGHKPSNVVVSFVQEPHATLKRKDNDLIYTHAVTLEQALQSEPVKIKVLDGRSIIATIDEIISPQTVKVVEGEGMPISQSPNADALSVLTGSGQLPRGNLYIRFDIQFPKKISNNHKQTLINTLR